MAIGGMCFLSAAAHTLRWILARLASILVVFSFYSLIGRIVPEIIIATMRHTALMV